jgi:hypothetical protein
MEFQLPLIEATKGCDETKENRPASSFRSLKFRKTLKINSMPLNNNKLIKDVTNSYEVEKHFTILSTIGTGTYAKVYLGI